MYINNNGKFNEAIAFWDFKMDESKIKDIDVIFYIHSYKPVAKYNYEFFTLEHDLKNITEEKLFKGYRSTLRNNIRNAKKMGLTFVHIDSPTSKDIEKFVEIFNSFAEFKGLSKLSNNLLKAMAEEGKLVLTMIKKGDEILTVHSHYVSEGRARLYHSASTLNSLTASENGLANKLLTHLDFLHFAKTCDIYDMGGIGDAKHGKEPFANIIWFKSSFGGKEVTHYKGVTPVGPNGQAVYDKYWK